MFLLVGLIVSVSASCSWLGEDIFQIQETFPSQEDFYFLPSWELCSLSDPVKTSDPLDLWGRYRGGGLIKTRLEQTLHASHLRSTDNKRKCLLDQYYCRGLSRSPAQPSLSFSIVWSRVSMWPVVLSPVSLILVISNSRAILQFNSVGSSSSSEKAQAQLSKDWNKCND